MTATIIDGKKVASLIRAECRDRVGALTRATGKRPGLAVMLIGNDPASAVYVRNKISACESAGVQSFSYHLPSHTGTATLVDLIEQLNQDANVDGVLVQLPLPPHVDMTQVLEAISPHKDVDGFHLYNVGGLVTGNTVFSPCTPYGVVKLLESQNICIEGQNVVVVGASNIVGKLMALMLMHRNATVAICHAKTRDLAQFTILADILVVAAGQPGLIGAQMVKRGAVVIDVGINRLPDGHITGDVVFDEVKERASHITPVPGGVGPMTVTMLLVNTIASAERRAGIRPKGLLCGS